MMETTWDEDETVFDAALGSVLFFFASQGSFSKAMPSDVAKIGANAVESIKANGSNYANETQKAVLEKFMRKYSYPLDWQLPDDQKIDPVTSIDYIKRYACIA